MEILTENEIYFTRNKKTLKLPGCLLYSRGGMVPHLTKDNLDNVTTEDFACHIPLSTVYQQPGLDVMESFGNSFQKFSNSEEKIYFLNINDMYCDKPEMYKYNEEKSISIWVPGGRRKVTPDEFMKYFQTFGFDICIAPSDSIPEDCAKKRCSKSVNRTLKFLDRCLEIKKDKKIDAPVFGVVEGGDNPFDREKCAKEVAKRNVDGYVLSGFHTISRNWKELLINCMKHLDKEKPKMILGVLTPLEVIEAVKLDIQLFDSVIAYDVTERNCALCFKYKSKKRQVEVNGDGIQRSNDIDKLPGDINEINGKDDTGEIKDTKQKNLFEYEFCLKEKRFFNDKRPVVEGCSCYCCVRYTRAYVHHLLVTNEMLAPVLLMIHNLHHWLSFFKEVRRHKVEGRIDDLKDIILNNIQ